jgi:hypothetical protein
MDREIRRFFRARLTEPQVSLAQHISEHSRSRFKVYCERLRISLFSNNPFKISLGCIILAYIFNNVLSPAAPPKEARVFYNRMPMI